MGGKPYHYVGIKLKLKILRIEIHDMSYGDCYVFDLVDNIGKSLFQPPEYPLYTLSHALYIVSSMLVWIC